MDDKVIPLDIQQSVIEPIHVDEHLLPKRKKQKFGRRSGEPELKDPEERIFQQYLEEMQRPIRQGDVAKIINHITKHIEEKVVEPRIKKLEALMEQLIEKL